MQCSMRQQQNHYQISICYWLACMLTLRITRTGVRTGHAPTTPHHALLYGVLNCADLKETVLTCAVLACVMLSCRTLMTQQLAQAINQAPFAMPCSRGTLRHAVLCLAGMCSAGC